MPAFEYKLDKHLLRRKQQAIEYVRAPCEDSLGVVTWGTRGSKDVCSPDKLFYGGNTTCLELRSRYFHPELRFYLDAGGGMQPAGEAAGPFLGDILRGTDHLVAIGFTHYHWDHIVGLPFIGYPFIDQAACYVFGPKSQSVGPKEALAHGAFKKPFFPIPFQQIGSHFQFKNISSTSSLVGLMHPSVLGVRWLPKIDYQKKQSIPSSTVSIPRLHHQPEYRDRTMVPLSECVKIFMLDTYHPDPTISYAFEMPDGKKFVFLTDHELQESVSQEMLTHLSDADCLIIDCQYKYEEYRTMYTGWGHGCDAYVVNLCKEAKVKNTILTHHDPKRTDSGVDSLLNEVSKSLPTALAAGDYGILKL